MKRSGVRLTVCPIIIRPPHAAAAGLLLCARRAGDIDRLLHGRRSAANASSVTFTAGVEKLNTDWLLCSSVSVRVRPQAYLRNCTFNLHHSLRMLPGRGSVYILPRRRHLTFAKAQKDSKSSFGTLLAHDALFIAKHRPAFT